MNSVLKMYPENFTLRKIRRHRFTKKNDYHISTKFTAPQSQKTEIVKKITKIPEKRTACSL